MVSQHNVYRAPQSDLNRIARGGFVFEPMHPRARTLAGCLEFYACLSAIVGTASLLMLVGGARGEAELLTAAEIVVLASTIASIAFFVITAVLFCRFLYRANQNVRALGIRATSFTPASMVWWHFIPVFHLFKPLQAIQDVYRSSFPAKESPAIPSLIGTWWTAWIVANVVGNVSGIVPEDNATATLVFTLLSTGSGVLSAILGARVVHLLAERQDRTAELLARSDSTASGFSRR